MKKLILITLTLLTAACGGRGPAGQDGLNSLTRVERTEDGAVIFTGTDSNRNSQLEDTEVTSFVHIRDGQDAQYLVYDVFDPCGPSNGLDEVLLVTNFGVLAWYKNTGLVILENGRYRTGDQQRCEFVVNNGQVF